MLLQEFIFEKSLPPDIISVMKRTNFFIFKLLLLKTFVFLLCAHLLIESSFICFNENKVKSQILGKGFVFRLFPL